MDSDDPDDAASPPSRYGSSIDGPSDAELITLVRGGDRSAFGALYARHVAAATTLARQFARSAAEADDLVSEAFARLLDALIAGKGPDSAFRAYLFTTVRHAAFDRTRKDSRLQFEGDIGEHDQAVTVDDPVIAGLESDLVARAFGSLPERWQTVLWHTQVEGESPQQVGVLLGLTPNAVTSLAFRAREGLREAYLQAHLADTAAERCRATVGRLGAYVRGGLSKRENAQVEAHLAECDRCRALATELVEMNRSLRAVLAPLVLGGAAAGYLASAPRAAAASTAGPVAAAAGVQTGGTMVHATAAAWWTRPPLIAAAGAGVVAAVAAAAVIWSAGSGEPGNGVALAAPAAESSPSSVTRSSPAAPSSAAVPTSLPRSTSSTPASTSEHPTTTGEPPPVSTPATTTGLVEAADIAVSTVPPLTTSPAAPTSPPPPKTTTSATSKAPPAITLTAPAFTAAAITAPAGGTASATFTVTNTGTSASSSRTSTITFPTGISLADVTIAVGPAGSGLRHRSAPAVAAARPAAPAAATVQCVGNTCTYSVPPASKVSITLRIAVGADAQSGNLVLRTPGAGPAVVKITVRRPATTSATPTSAPATTTPTTTESTTETGEPPPPAVPSATSTPMDTPPATSTKPIHR